MANPPVEFAATARSRYFAPQPPNRSCQPERSEDLLFSDRDRAAQNSSAAACRRLLLREAISCESSECQPQ